MQADRRIPSPILTRRPIPSPPLVTALPLQWDWDQEHEDRKRERALDHSHLQMHVDEFGAFEVDRKAMKDIIEEKMQEPVGRIVFLSSGTFHKAYIVTLGNTGLQVIFRVARRYMPKLKTLSEVATVRWLSGISNGTEPDVKGPKVKVVVPEIYDWDSNPWNRVGGEWILMQKAPGVPLSQVYHSLSYHSLMKLLENLARLVIPLFGHRWDRMGSLYLSKDIPKDFLEDHSCYDTSEPTPLNNYFSTPVTHGLGDATPTINTPTVNSFKPLIVSAPPPPVNLKFNFAFTPLVDTSTHAVSTPQVSTPLLAPKAMSRTQSAMRLPPSLSLKRDVGKYSVGPIVSWPYFGSHRGLLSHPTEINRGPFPSLDVYMRECISREVEEVVRENEGKRKPHKLHLDPAEIMASRRHHLDFKTLGDAGKKGKEKGKGKKKHTRDESYDDEGFSEGESSDDSEWDQEESELEWDGPGDMMYRDYRRVQRTTFLVAHLEQRRQKAELELGRWSKVMKRLRGVLEEEKRVVLEDAVVDDTADNKTTPSAQEQFGLDCHDLSLENVFVDPDHPHNITSIIDWESTTTRPLWACAHLPAFLQSSPFTAKLFRQIVVRFAEGQSVSPSSSQTGSSSTGDEEPTPVDPAIAKEWLFYEQNGARLRMAHRVVEWDGWEEGLVDSILGEPEDEEETWFAPSAATADDARPGDLSHLGSSSKLHLPAPKALKKGGGAQLGALKVATNGGPEMEKEMVLDTTGDICVGVGGELGRRLEAWLSESAITGLASPNEQEISV